MTTYAFRGPTGDVVASFPEFARPVPRHALEASSVTAVATMRRVAAQRRVDALMGRVVREVGRAPAEPWEGDPVASGAVALSTVAADAGFEIRQTTTHDAVTVEGAHPSLCGFRATWRRGRFLRGSWHAPWCYALIEDRREVAIDQRARVGKAGYRSPGMGTERLSITATPWGMSVNLTELKQRIAALTETA